MDAPISQADTKARFAGEIAKHMRRTFGPRVIEGEELSDGLFSLDYDTALLARNYEQPVLVSSASGAGAKAALAREMNRHETIGVDVVANAVNRIVARGAEPLFFSAYMESAHLDPQSSFAVVEGMANACCEAECSFIEMETPERPAAYGRGEYHLVGFAVGVAERGRLVGWRQMEPDDVIIALPSSGLHTHGHTLARRIFFDQLKMSPAARLDALESPLGEELLRPTRIYVRALRRVLAAYRVKKVVRAVACVGDGGLAGAVKRLLPEGFSALVQVKSLPPAPIFDALRVLGELDHEEMFDLFNMGVGMVIAASRFFAGGIAHRLKREGVAASVIGKVRRGPRRVEFEF